MKEMTFQPEMIVGGMLILWGVTILIKLIWGIDIPFWRPLFGISLIYFGLLFLFKKDTITTYKRTMYTYTIHDEDQERR